jgi:hypothetical protein
MNGIHGCRGDTCLQCPMFYTILKGGKVGKVGKVGKIGKVGKVGREGK